MVSMITAWHYMLHWLWVWKIWFFTDIFLGCIGCDNIWTE